jgi:hypothetical protein
MSCCLGVSRPADKQAYSVIPEDPFWLILAILFHIHLLDNLRGSNHVASINENYARTGEKTTTKY